MTGGESECKWTFGQMRQFDVINVPHSALRSLARTSSAIFVRVEASVSFKRAASARTAFQHRTLHKAETCERGDFYFGSRWSSGHFYKTFWVSGCRNRWCDGIWVCCSKADIWTLFHVSQSAFISFSCISVKIKHQTRSTRRLSPKMAAALLPCLDRSRAHLLTNQDPELSSAVLHPALDLSQIYIK